MPYRLSCLILVLVSIRLRSNYVCEKKTTGGSASMGENMISLGRARLGRHRLGASSSRVGQARQSSFHTCQQGVQISSLIRWRRVDRCLNTELQTPPNSLINNNNKVATHPTRHFLGYQRPRCPSRCAIRPYKADSHPTCTHYRSDVVFWTISDISLCNKGSPQTPLEPML